jgi:elongation factor Ts
MKNNAANVEELKSLKLGDRTVGETLVDQMGKIGEKIDIVDYQNVKADKVVIYNHPGN